MVPEHNIKLMNDFLHIKVESKTYLELLSDKVKYLTLYLRNITSVPVFYGINKISVRGAY
mgnify:CR=1 FL=1